MPAIYHEGSWLGNATDPEVLVKDTVGWTGKNRAYSQTNNAVIAHIKSGITYDVSWTGSATVTLKKNSASGATITSGSTSPLSFTADADYELYFGSSATVTNIMVKDSRITDPTYEPYHESVEVMYEEEIHGVNLLKNEATTQTINGVTFTVNSDGSVRANGTATTGTGCAIFHGVVPKGDYIFSGDNNAGITGACLAIDKYMDSARVGQIVNTFSHTEEAITIDYDGYNTIHVVVWINANVTVSNLIFKPMLRKANIEDSTYRPYNPQAIQNQLNAQGVLGAKNFLQANATSRTVNGVTFTLNDDKSFTVNGTATADTYFESHIMSAKANDVYIVSDNLANPSDSTYRGKVMGKTTGIDYAFLTTGKEKKFTVTNTEKIVYSFKVKSGQTVSNITFKPMIRLASDPDDTYQPYAMTNRELTEKKINIADLKTVVSASSDFADFKTRIASL